MLFSSHVFVFGFLPIAVLGYVVIDSRCGHRIGLLFLLAASYFFYAWGENDYLAVLILVTSLNYIIGRQIAASYQRGCRALLRAWGIVGIGGNLLILAYFKYAAFLLETANAVIGSNFPIPSIALPLGISFFTFHGLAYLIETYKGGAAERSVVKFALFLGFFPHMVAGPILRPAELLPQLEAPVKSRLNYGLIAQGLGMFAFGLFKKSCLADSIAPYANAVFDGVAAGGGVGLLDAWAGALAYSMQIYFDFSGYSDMAIGIALFFGIRLPLNFDSPYRATSLIDFWRRWHMTLSRFLRDYLYIPLGGNRKGSSHRYINILITMSLGGLWHGASWTFVLWGCFHGILLCVNHLWRATRSQERRRSFLSVMLMAHLATFVCVVVAWVFFRAADLRSAVQMVTAMFGGSDAPSWEFAKFVQPETGIGILVGLLVIIWLMPNTQTVMGYTQPNRADAALAFRWLRWKPDIKWSVAVAIMLAAAILNLSDATEFIYFHF